MKTILTIFSLIILGCFALPPAYALETGAADDPSEQEADAVADRARPSPVLRKPAEVTSAPATTQGQVEVSSPALPQSGRPAAPANRGNTAVTAH